MDSHSLGFSKNKQSRKEENNEHTRNKEIIPHRYPMLLIDRVEEMVEGERIVAKKNVTINEPFSRTFSRRTCYARGIDC